MYSRGRHASNGALVAFAAVLLGILAADGIHLNVGDGAHLTSQLATTGGNASHSRAGGAEPNHTDTWRPPEERGGAETREAAAPADPARTDGAAAGEQQRHADTPGSGEPGALVEVARSSASSVPLEDTVSIDVYYEATDYYSKRFIQSSVLPLWRNSDTRSRISLRLYPYGRTKLLLDLRAKSNRSMVENGWPVASEPSGGHFQCARGAEGCYRNVLENCAISHLNDADLYLPFISCFTEKLNLSRVADTGFGRDRMGCFTAGAVSDTDLGKIQACAGGREGGALLSNAGDATRKLKDPSQEEQTWAELPWVLIDGHRSEQAELDGKAGTWGSLAAEVCARLVEPRPIFCVLGEVGEVNLTTTPAEEPFMAEDEMLERVEPITAGSDRDFVAEDERLREEPLGAAVRGQEQGKPFMGQDEIVPDEPFTAEDEQETRDDFLAQR